MLPDLERALRHVESAAAVWPGVERRSDSLEAQQARRLEALMGDVIRMQAATTQTEILNAAAHAARRCVGGDWAVLAWRPPQQAAEMVCIGTETSYGCALVLDLTALPTAHATGAWGVLRVGRAGLTDFDRSDRVLLAHAAVAAVVALERAHVLAKSLREVHGRDEILAMVSHDLRGPVAVAHAGANELIDGPADPVAVKAVASTVARAADQMARLLADLLDSAQSAAGTFAVDLKPIALRTLIHEVGEAGGIAARRRDIAVVVDDVADEVLVQGDRQRLLQVFGNLIGNAIKFTPIGGEIRIEVQVEAQRVVCRVRDTGPGVPEEHRAHIFERFWKGHTRADGAGLGLYIAHSIIDAHHGVLELEPQQTGTGAAFSFALPRA